MANCESVLKKQNLSIYRFWLFKDTLKKGVNYSIHIKNYKKQTLIINIV